MTNEQKLIFIYGFLKGLASKLSSEYKERVDFAIKFCKLDEIFNDGEKKDVAKTDKDFGLKK